MQTPESFAHIAKIILEKKRLWKKIVVVVSAMGDATDQLIELAKQVHPSPPKRELDMLISVGERVSISLLAMALSQYNGKAVSFTGSQSGIITCPMHACAKIIDVRPQRILEKLQEDNIVIVAGFQGVSLQKEITTLGRGGSDTSAVALAVALRAERVEFYKDVDGIFSDDPKKNPLSQFYPYLSYDQAIVIAGKGLGVLHKRCLQLAKKNHMPLLVKSFISYNNKKMTRIGRGKPKKDCLPQYEEINGFGN